MDEAWKAFEHRPLRAKRMSSHPPALRPAEAGSDLDPLDDDCGGFLEELCGKT